MELSNEDLMVITAALETLVDQWEASQEEIDLLNRIDTYLEELNK